MSRWFAVQAGAGFGGCTDDGEIDDVVEFLKALTDGSKRPSKKPLLLVTARLRVIALTEPS